MILMSCFLCVSSSFNWFGDKSFARLTFQVPYCHVERTLWGLQLQCHRNCKIFMDLSVSGQLRIVTTTFKPSHPFLLQRERETAPSSAFPTPEVSRESLLAAKFCELRLSRAEFASAGFYRGCARCYTGGVVALD